MEENGLTPSVARIRIDGFEKGISGFKLYWKGEGNPRSNHGIPLTTFFFFSVLATSSSSLIMYIFSKMIKRTFGYYVNNPGLTPTALWPDWSTERPALSSARPDYFKCRNDTVPPFLASFSFPLPFSFTSFSFLSHYIYIYIYLYTLCTHVMCTLPRIPVSRVFLFFRVCTRGLRSRFINLIVGKGARSSSLVVLRIYIYG